MRLSSSPSPPSTPSAPPKASARTGIRVLATSSSPNSNVSTSTVEAIVDPVTPCSRTASALIGRLSSAATLLEMAERLAPVSSTSRYGPIPLISTGAQMRPMRSRVVGAT
jgi:hypothetical protein